MTTAKLLVQQARNLGRRPVILLSGGLDSEVVVKAFLDAAPGAFDLATFRYPNHLNDHELKYVKLFCDRHDLHPTYYDIDILNWARSNEARQLFLDSECAYFEMVPHMRLVSEIWEHGGFPILGNGEVLLEKVNRAWQYVEYEYDLAWYRHAAHNGIGGTMGFFQHTSEIVLAALLDPQTVNLGTGKNGAANALLRTSREIKYKMYRDHWPDLEKRTKFHGAEKLGSFLPELAATVGKHRALKYDDKWLLPYSDFVSLISPDHSLATEPLRPTQR